MALRRINLAWQFALVSALIFAAVGVGTAAVTARSLGAAVTKEALEEAAGEAADLAASRVLPRLAPDDLKGPMSAQRFQDLDRFVTESVLSRRVAFVKVWSRDGTVVYSSDDPREVGQRYPENEELLEALSGNTVSEVGAMESVTHTDERYLEVYVPLKFSQSSEPAGAFEIYQAYEPVARLVADIRTSVYLAMAGGFTVMYITLLLVVSGGADIIGRQSRDLRRRASELERSQQEALVAVVRALDLRDVETQHHSVRVQRLSLVIAQRMAISPGDLVTLQTAALLHDVGKIGVPDHVLRKPGPLSAREWEAMRQHPEQGYLLLKELEFLRPAAEIVYSHHERFDGAGYPRGLAGESIPFLARIFAVADAYEAMTSDRPYRKALPHHRGVEEIRRNAGSQFDPRVVAAFLQAVEEETSVFVERPLERDPARAA